MARTLFTNRFSRVLACCCVVWLLLVFGSNGALADSNNSSGEVSSSDRTDDGEKEENTVEKGMRPFFDMVKSFLGVVQPNRITEESWLNLSTIVVNGEVQDDQLTDWKNWTMYLIGFVVCAAVGVLFVVVMPITGLVFCCCRCSGRCGGRSKPQDPKHAGCKRTTFCTLLLIFNTVALAGVVCTFLSNQILYDKMRNVNNDGPTGKLINSVDLVNGFTNTTIDEVGDAVLGRFLRAKDSIINNIQDSAGKAVEEVLDVLNATALLDQSKTVAEDVNEVQDELTNIANKLHFLSAQGTLLSDNLTAINNDVASVCTPPSSCPGYNANDYAVSANFSHLDTLSTEAENVAKSANLSEYIKQAEDVIESTKQNATDSVESGIDDSKGTIDSVEQSLRDGVSEFTGQLQKAITTEVNKFRSDVLDAEDDISEISKYVWYGGIAVGCALLLVVVMYYTGILFGLCGERPGFGAQCCNTGTGANFLMGGVGITFLLGWLVMAICIVTFVVGGPVYTEVCRYFDDHDPQELKPFSDAVMNLVNFQEDLYDGKDVNLNLVDILEGCKNNSPIYSVLRLDNMVNITEYADLTEVEKALNDLKNNAFQIPEITIVTSEMNQSLTDFANAGLDTIPYDVYYEEIDKNLTQEELPALSQELRAIANTQGVPEPQKQVLLAAADQLDELHTQIVVPMQEAEMSLKNSLMYLQNQAQSQIKESINSLLNGLQKAENMFNSEKDTLVGEQVDELIDSVMTQIEGVVQDILTALNEDIGKCRAVYDSFYSATDAACVAALEPLNGLWFSIGWCLFFFVPLLIFAVKLAGLYRREHEERDFDDPNFSQYEGRKQDSIPLTSRQQSGRASASHGQGGGVANSGYQEDSYMGLSDYPNYKGGAVNAGYQHDGYTGPSPPPYGSHANGHGAVNGNPKDKDYRMFPY